MTKTINLIVTDLDGTLLNNQHQMTERTEKALRAALDKGVRIVLATGKTRTSAQEIIQKLNLTTPGIFVQGLVICGGEGEILHQQTMDVNIARQVITFAEDRGFYMAAYSGASIIARNQNPIGNFFVDFHEPLPDPVGPLQNILGELPVNKLIAVGDPQRIKSLRWQLAMQHNGSIKLVQSHVPTVLEILPAGASKGNALKVLLPELGVPAHEVLAIGDAENDIDMMQLAGIGVAVGNADETTKAAADYVVASNNNDGVGEAVERFVLGIDPSAVDAKPAKTEAPAVTPEKAEAEEKSES
jgi:Cof subfamily protein (haloacid dehalogenase superfamily)